MTTASIETVPGTCVEEVVRYTDSPVEDELQQSYFHNGWWQIVVSGDGKNPSFPEGSWAIVLLAPINKDLKPVVKNEGICAVMVDPHIIIKKIATKIEVQKYEDIDWEYPVIVIDVHSESTGDEEFCILCGDPQPIEKPPLQKFN
jgi:hypothetical protein